MNDDLGEIALFAFYGLVAWWLGFDLLGQALLGSCALVLVEIVLRGKHGN